MSDDGTGTKSDALPGPPLGLEEETEMEFQVAPMVDVLLVLLLFFMATTTTEVITQTANLDLPKAEDSKAPEKGGGELVINVEKLNFQIKMNDVYYQNADDIVPILKAERERTMAGPMAEKGFRVLIRADKETSFERVSGIMKACAQAGVIDVIFGVADEHVGNHGEKK